MGEKKATRDAYGQALVDLGSQDSKIVVLDADLAKPWGGLIKGHTVWRSPACGGRQ
ncbi:hypothetical protein HKBW3S03_00701 [Candidatus Hakubella thermalkaliphila]|uniref:Transketolase n=1 Tax=Candidatus Hakubella thermalkaliphila TaxID=2754717 RepID=A0A6V8QCA3_9ACTN|nr:hypothetical protein [Candidatus Hakubella thermalkaliphila]MBT9170168.1 hypothetical protein [Actinomycetota bacterium]GFP19196.1 hypothetical protein HKBW3S03_00701 [Candidatus Hakubella thermalkaliphila]GFP30634.1 hypothetical protein HKBW3S34_01554 [Candidatus Hakubella thermalkaliphila]GFP39055.1 hypothetical protein HKBW3S47_00755 [Candidatus Hakubella thermalkaliphila]GFP42247.1 hypothetical protein HKBW3C_01373 [Candidatus Hakubella thermalkaliphila]